MHYIYIYTYIYLLTTSTKNSLSCAIYIYIYIYLSISQCLFHENKTWDTVRSLFSIRWDFLWASLTNQIRTPRFMSQVPPRVRVTVGVVLRVRVRVRVKG